MGPGPKDLPTAGSGEVLMIEGGDGGRFPHAHSLFVDDRIPAVIDPADRPEILEGIAKEREVGVVLNSHYHVDHVRYNHLFSDAKIMVHRLDAPCVESLDEMAGHVGVECEPWVDSWKRAMRERFGYQESVISRRLEHGDTIDLGHNTIKVLHTPGHTGGHCCFQFMEKRSVYLADIDLTSFGPWYGNLSSDVDEFIASVGMLKGLDAEVYYSAHGKPVYRGDIGSILDEYISVVYRREEKILDFLSLPRDFHEIVKQLIVYRKKWKPEQLLYFLEGMMIRKHLKRLERLGRVVREGERWERVR